MKPGYSKLLINENVIPDIEADWQLAALDLMMMTMVSSGERKEQQWRQLLEKAGLRILKIWSYENEVESLIECVRRRERVEEKRWNYHVCIVYLYDSVGCRYLVLLGSRTLVCFSKSFTK